MPGAAVCMRNIKAHPTSILVQPVATASGLPSCESNQVIRARVSGANALRTT